MAFNVRLDAFEGPFDLLFHLIEKNKIDIYDIPIAELTDQYLGYLEDIGEQELDIASEFLVMAATLLSIKSKMLLPSPKHEVQLELAVGRDEEDPRNELVKRLIEYKRYKEISLILKQREEEQLKIFKKLPEDITHFWSEDFSLEGITFDDVMLAFKNLHKKSEHTQQKHHSITKDPLPLAKRIKDVLYFIKRQKAKVMFSRIISPNCSKLDFIVTFLAILELVKRNRILAEQEKNFDEIVVTLKESQ
jgi:segregation and condensation protein A